MLTGRLIDKHMPDTSQPDNIPESPPQGNNPAATEAKQPIASPPVKAPPLPKKKDTEMITSAWEGALPTFLKERFGDQILQFAKYQEQDFLVAGIDATYGILETLRDDQAFDYLVDLTAVHWPEKEQQFEIIWILYSFQKNIRIRVKAEIAEGAKAPSVTSLYSAANWLEREVYDMFGIEFENHPDLKRILLPDEWEGFPLRKEHGLIQQDEQWVRENLKIESAQ